MNPPQTNVSQSLNGQIDLDVKHPNTPRVPHMSLALSIVLYNHYVVHYDTL